MCDTMVALGSMTVDGSVILAKNSDREPNEAQAITFVPGQVFAAGAETQCTYITVPQTRQTLDVLLSRPFWMWGCEMGVNAAGVAIGNEAVFTKEPHQSTGLLGMDMMRLALERAETAQSALDMITDLLATYGQGGVAGYRNRSMRYHNSFIIADPTSAWVLETAGRYWAARRVRDTASISNGITIGNDFDLASPGLVEHAIERGWCRSEADFDFGRCYSDLIYTRFSQCRVRQARTTAGLQGGPHSVGEMMAMLRRHEHDDASWSPARSNMGSVCMHAGGKLLRDSQSTGSLVAHLRAEGPTAWITGTSAPCLSVFKPFVFDGADADIAGSAPGEGYDPQSLWWRHERVHRDTLRAHNVLHRVVARELHALQERFLSEEQALTSRQASAHERQSFVQSCWQQAEEALVDWGTRVSQTPARERQPFGYQLYWRRQNASARLPVPTKGALTS